MSGQKRKIFLTSWIHLRVKDVIADSWRKGRRLYLRQILRAADPKGKTYLDAGTVRRELEYMVYWKWLTRRKQRIITDDGKARIVVYYEPTESFPKSNA